jgi:tetratricopeptide (TPR) repeat protein
MKVTPIICLAFSLAFAVSCYKPTVNNSSTRSSSGNTSGGSTSQSPEVSSPTTSSSSGDYSKAIEAYNAKKYEEAAKGFEAVTKNDPKNFDAQYHLGKSYEGLKKVDDAVRAYKAAITLKPEHADSNFSAGKIEYDRKNYQAALPFLDQAAKTDFKSPKTLLAFGENQRMLKMFDRAIVQYGKVIGFEPDNAEAYYGLGLTYIGLNNKIAAGQQVRKLEALDKGLAKKLADMIDK